MTDKDNSTPKPKKRSTLLGAMNSQTLSEAQATTKNVARKVNSENHKVKKATIIPEEFTTGGTSPARIFNPLHKQLKIYAAQSDSDIQTCVNEAIYAMLIKNGMIKPE